MSATRQHVHQLVDRLDSGQLGAVGQLFEAMVHADEEAQPISMEEEAAVARSKEWFKHNEGIPFEQVVAELGFTMDQIRNPSDPKAQDPAA